MAGVDFDRGVQIRVHHGGARICMYIDDPGVFLDINGGPVSDKMASEAGYPVEDLKIEAKKRTALDQAKADIERQFSAQDEDANRVAEAAVLGPLEVRHLARGSYAIFSSEGEQVTRASLTKKQAEALVSAFVTEATAD